MNKYMQFAIWCEDEVTDSYIAICDKLAKYTTDDEKMVYWLPVDTPDYHYIKNLASTGISGVTIQDTGIAEIKYTKEEYANAACYLVNFRAYISGYDSIPILENFEECCNNSSWKYVTGMKQVRPYRIPPSEFRRKKVGIFIPGFGMNNDLTQLLIDNGLAQENDFIEVYDKYRKKVVAHQLTPQNVFSGFCKDNNMRLVDSCSACGLQRYETNGEPYYISKETLEKLKNLNRTVEVTGPVIEDIGIKEYDPEDCCSFIAPWIIVSKEVYEFMKGYISYKNFIPVFCIDE